MGFLPYMQLNDLLTKKVTKESCLKNKKNERKKMKKE